MKVIGMLLLVCAGTLLAQEPVSLKRDEVAVIKKKLVAVLDALGSAPKDYGVENESFNLPTEAYPTEGKWRPTYGSANRRYSTSVGKEKSEKDLQDEYQKKILEAQAKGDYVGMSKIATEMQQKMAQQQIKSTEAQKEPIEVNVQLNQNPGTTIDPDAVLFEKPGVIGLKTQNDINSGKERVIVAFDPVALKTTGQLSKLDLAIPNDGVSSKTAVLTIVVDLYGPSAEVEGWAKRLNTGSVLSQVSGK
jgi:hypothetical protein